MDFLFLLPLALIALWTMAAGLMAILAWSHALLNRPFRWLPWANEAVYPWYMLHQSLTVLAAYWLVERNLGGPLESALVLLLTVLGCWAIFAMVRRIGWLRPLFGMKPAQREKLQLTMRPSW